MFNRDEFSPDNLQARIEKVESEREKYVIRMGRISLVVKILVVITTLLQSSNETFEYVENSKYFAIPAILCAGADLIYEYVIRRYVSFMEGRSQHIIKVHAKIVEILKLKDRLLGSNTVVAMEELNTINTKLQELLNQITFEDSNRTVVSVEMRL